LATVCPPNRGERSTRMVDAPACIARDRSSTTRSATTTMTTTRRRLRMRSRGGTPRRRRRRRLAAVPGPATSAATHFSKSDRASVAVRRRWNRCPRKLDPPESVSWIRRRRRPPPAPSDEPGIFTASRFTRLQTNAQ